MVTVDSPGQLLIGGAWRGGQDGTTFEITEPATSEVMATAAVATPADVDAAVSAARAAFESGAWSEAPASVRAKVLYRIAELIRSEVDQLATLEARNAAILKPASYTPLTALELGRIALEAGLPEGVLNVITGPGSSTGSALAGHPGVDKIAFTGETSTGVSILQLAAPNITRVSLELGGKSPNIIFADADLEKAAPAAVNSVFGNAGQDCCARSRAFVHRSIAEEFDQRVAAGARALNVR